MNRSCQAKSRKRSWTSTLTSIPAEPPEISFTVTVHHLNGWLLGSLVVGGEETMMVIDTGSPVSSISQNTYDRLLPTGFITTDTRRWTLSDAAFACVRGISDRGSACARKPEGNDRGLAGHSRSRFPAALRAHSLPCADSAPHAHLYA